MERLLDLAILPVVLVYLLLVGAFFVVGVLLIAKVRRNHGMWVTACDRAAARRLSPLRCKRGRLCPSRNTFCPPLQ